MTARKDAQQPSRPRYGLAAWQASFARYVAETFKPSVAEQVRIANSLANEYRADGAPEISISYDQVKWLKRRRDFRELSDALREGGVKAAQAYLSAKYPRLAELHVWGAEEAMRRGDVRALASFTVPPMDRYAPKRPDVALLAPQQIVIQVSPQRIAANAMPVMEIEAVPVSPGAAPALAPTKPKEEPAERARPAASLDQLAERSDERLLDAGWKPFRWGVDEPGYGK